jgi:hypothetical protein
LLSFCFVNGDDGAITSRDVPTPLSLFPSICSLALSLTLSLSLCLALSHALAKGEKTTRLYNIHPSRPHAPLVPPGLKLLANQQETGYRKPKISAITVLGFVPLLERLPDHTSVTRLSTLARVHHVNVHHASARVG